MNIGVFSPMPSAVADPAVVAKRAEELGFESYWVPDHPILPVGAEKEYPGASSDSDESAVAFLSRIPDPLIVLARAGAVTRNIKLDKDLAMKRASLATLDEACQGRFLFGIGAGWNKTECELLGGDFPHRWGQTKDFIAAMRTLWKDEEAEYKGKYVEFSPVRCYPKPSEKNGPPVLVGGIGSPYVYRRVAEWGDGWIPLIADMAAFEEGMDKLTGACEGVGRDMATVDVTIFGMSGQWRRRDQTRQLEKGGANRVVIWINARDSQGAIQEMEALATDLL